MFLTESTDRQHTVPYPSQPSAPVVGSPKLSNKAAKKALLRDAPGTYRPTEFVSTTRKTNTRLARSESGTVYALLPYTTSSEVTREPPTGDEDLPGDHPSQITEVDLYEDVLSRDMNDATHEDMANGVGSPTSRRNAPDVVDDDEVVAIAKKVLEYYKKAAVIPGIEPEAGEEERK